MSTVIMSKIIATTKFRSKIYFFIISCHFVHYQFQKDNLCITYLRQHIVLQHLVLHHIVNSGSRSTLTLSTILTSTKISSTQIVSTITSSTMLTSKSINSTISTSTGLQSTWLRSNFCRTYTYTYSFYLQQPLELSGLREQKCSDVGGAGLEYSEMSRQECSIGPTAPTFWWCRNIVSRQNVTGPTAPTFFLRWNCIFDNFKVKLIFLEYLTDRRSMGH